MPEDRDALVEKALDAYECEKNRWQVTPVERSIYDKDGRPAYSTYLFVRGPFVGLARYHSAAVPEAESFERFEASAIHKESVPHEAAMQAAILSILPPTTSAGDGELVERLREQLLETQMRCYKWMDAHDNLKAGRPYSFPAPADLPDALARVKELEEALRGILEDSVSLEAAMASARSALNVCERGVSASPTPRGAGD